LIPLVDPKQSEIHIPTFIHKEKEAKRNCGYC